ncbi:class I SAM-dependent methyltransferase [Nocardia sp. CS682]|uniref:class I SAM-dependent methyltransferase n=1 Tax=Nocardia sp. CS682 TaxID=1047172 RepID=UPI001980D7CA|nr:class I SAM-dependent methyltransferase [Nocardia sp. CS682]
MIDRGNQPEPASNTMFDYDAELRRYHRWLSEALDVGPSDHVLDIGCGTGQLTRDSAELAYQGSALGVDISPVMLGHAGRLAAAAEIPNVRFEQADAQVYPFPPEHFTRAASRFGTMFFADPVEAFTNIGRAMQPGSKLVQLVWQDSAEQEWVAAIHRALTGTATPTAGTGAFSLGDPARVEDILTAAGFKDISITDLREPIYYGADPDAGVDAVRVLHMTTDLLSRLDADETQRALDRLRTTMAEHHTADGVWFDSRAWLVTAHR